MRINLNDSVRFIPTRKGAMLWNQAKEIPWASPGQTVETQLWMLFVVFGPMMGHAGETLIEGNSLDLDEGDLSSADEAAPDPSPGLGDGHTETLATKIHSRMTHRLREIMGTSRLTERPDCSPPSNDSQLLRLFSEELANIHRRLVPVGPDYRTPARDVHRG